MPSARTAALVLILLVAGVLAGWYLSRPVAMAVAVTAVSRGPVLATVANTRAGTVDACQRARLAPAMGGQIARLPFRSGDRVEAGDVLVELWNLDLRAQLQQAERDGVAAASRARQACVTADVAARNARRVTALRQQGLVSEGEADQATGEAEAQAAACQAARDTERVSQARTAVVRADLERTLLRAPFAGVIAEINGEVGEFVTPSPVGIPTPPTVDLVDGSCLYISAPIDEVDAPAVRAGQRAVITLDAFPGQQFPGFVRRVAPYVLDVEKQARTVEIEAEFDMPREDLLPGYSADVEVILDSAADVLRIPSQALMEGRRVLVLNERTGTLEEREVGRGIANWEYTEIRTGLADGELVVTSIDRAGVRAGVRARRE